MAPTSLVWFRNDLRVSDNPALTAAFQQGGEVRAVYIHETDSTLRPIGGAARWWLHRSLRALAEDLAGIGVELRTATGPALATLFSEMERTGATAVFWNRRYAPAEREIDTAAKARAEKAGMVARSFAANVLVEPFEVTTGSGGPYAVYTPFWRNLRQRDIPRPLPRPRRREPITPAVAVDGDYRVPPWARKLEAYWTVGEAGAHQALERFLDRHTADYPETRDIPARDATSRLSPHLRFGEISPRQGWPAAIARRHRHGADAEQVRRPALAGGSRGARGLAGRPHWHPHCRCRDAGAVGDWDHAQPGPHAYSVAAGQKPADRLAEG